MNEAVEKLRDKIAKLVANSRCEVCNDCGASISTDNPDEVADQILLIIKEDGYLPVKPIQCTYCDKKPDGAMLVIGKNMAHATCVSQKLNELLDSDY